MLMSSETKNINQKINDKHSGVFRTYSVPQHSGFKTPVSKRESKFGFELQYDSMYIIVDRLQDFTIPAINHTNYY